MIELAAFVVLAIVGFAVFAASLVLLKAVVWIVLLPLRILLNFLLLPLLLLKALVGGLVLLLAGPILLVGILAGVLALGAALLAPLLPLLFVAFVVWFIMRATAKAPVPTRP